MVNSDVFHDIESNEFQTLSESTHRTFLASTAVITSTDGWPRVRRRATEVPSTRADDISYKRGAQFR
jgi:hypothetical protein